MIKKYFFSSLFILIALIVAGCGSAPTETSNNNSTETSPQSNNSNSQTTNSFNDSSNDSTTVDQLPDPNCGDGALLSYNCWTSRFPADISDRGDVTCSFLISCCGKNLGNGWETIYPDLAGLRGFVDSGAMVSSASCKDSPALGDLDGDGTPNESDKTPIGGDKNAWEENAEGNSGR